MIVHSFTMEQYKMIGFFHIFWQPNFGILENNSIDFHGSYIFQMFFWNSEIYHSLDWQRVKWIGWSNSKSRWSLGSCLYSNKYLKSTTKSSKKITLCSFTLKRSLTQFPKTWFGPTCKERTSATPRDASIVSTMTWRLELTGKMTQGCTIWQIKLAAATPYGRS